MPDATPSGSISSPRDILRTMLLDERDFVAWTGLGNTSSPATQYDRFCIGANAGNKRAATGSTATITTYKAHAFRAGDQVNVVNCGDASYNGTGKTVLSVPTTTTFTFALSAPKEEAETADAAVVILYGGTSGYKHAIPDMSMTLVAGHAYRYWMTFTIESAVKAGNTIGIDLAGGTATVSAIDFDGLVYSDGALVQTVAGTALDDLCGYTVTGDTTLLVTITGTLTALVGGTLVPRVFYPNSVNTLSVTTDSEMEVVDDSRLGNRVLIGDVGCRVQSVSVASGVLSITTYEPHGLTADVGAAISGCGASIDGDVIVATVPSVRSLTASTTADDVDAYTPEGAILIPAAHPFLVLLLPERPVSWASVASDGTGVVSGEIIILVEALVSTAYANDPRNAEVERDNAFAGLGDLLAAASDGTDRLGIQRIEVEAPPAWVERAEQDSAVNRYERWQGILRVSWGVEA